MTLSARIADFLARTRKAVAAAAAVAVPLALAYYGPDNLAVNAAISVLAAFGIVYSVKANRS